MWDLVSLYILVGNHKCAMCVCVCVMTNDIFKCKEFGSSKIVFDHDIQMYAISLSFYKSIPDILFQMLLSNMGDLTTKLLSRNTTKPGL